MAADRLRESGRCRHVTFDDVQAWTQRGYARAVAREDGHVMTGFKSLRDEVPTRTSGGAEEQ